MLQEELDYKSIEEIYWTDSKGVLGYINNDARRFHVFVANRVQQIRDHSSKDQWNYVDSKLNPADKASRGLKACDIVNDSRWINGPSFLYEADQDWKHFNQPDDKAKLEPDDVKVKKVTTFATSVKKFAGVVERLEYFSSWHRAKKAIANCLRYRRLLRQRVHKKRKKKDVENIEKAANIMKPDQIVTVEEMNAAEREIIKALQKEEFKQELSSLKSKLEVNVPETQRRRNTVARTSPIAKLDHFMDEHVVIRVGGRIRRSSMDANIKHPVVLPNRARVSKLIAKHFHQKIDHQGQGITWNTIRASGYWIVGCEDVVAKLIKDCAVCQRF
jgi:hypothetical protein